MKFLLKSHKPPTFKIKKLIKASLTNDEITGRILEWREYIAKRKDKKPDNVLHQSKLRNFSEKIRSDPDINVENLTELLKIFRVADNFLAGAKLLQAFLEPSREQLQKMENIICRACTEKGHTVR